MEATNFLGVRGIKNSSSKWLREIPKAVWMMIGQFEGRKLRGRWVFGSIRYYHRSFFENTQYWYDTHGGKWRYIWEGADEFRGHGAGMRWAGTDRGNLWMGLPVGRHIDTFSCLPLPPVATMATVH